MHELAFGAVSLRFEAFTFTFVRPTAISVTDTKLVDLEHRFMTKNFVKYFIYVIILLIDTPYRYELTFHKFEISKIVELNQKNKMMSGHFFSIFYNIGER